VFIEGMVGDSITNELRHDFFFPDHKENINTTTLEFGQE